MKPATIDKFFRVSVAILKPIVAVLVVAATILLPWFMIPVIRRTYRAKQLSTL
jgi:hypothetical protein